MARVHRRRRRASRASHGIGFHLTKHVSEQAILILLAAVIILAALAFTNVSPLGAPAGQQFAPVVGGADRCGDSDGIDYFTPGTVTSVLKGVQRSFDDYCASTVSLAEYYCSGNTADVAFVDCPAGCARGRCA